MIRPKEGSRLAPILFLLVLLWNHCPAAIAQDEYSGGTIKFSDLVADVKVSGDEAEKESEKAKESSPARVTSPSPTPYSEGNVFQERRLIDSPPDPKIESFTGEYTAILERIRALRAIRKGTSASKPPELLISTQPDTVSAAAPALNPGAMSTPPPSEPGAPTRFPNLTEDADAPEPAEPMVDPMDSLQILDESVDPLLVAENLYYTGNFAGSVMALAQVDPSEITKSDAEWSELLMALCKRRLGNSDEASAILRQLVAADPPGRYSTTAAWWLDHYEAEKRFTKTLEETNSRMQLLQERAQQHVR